MAEAGGQGRVAAKPADGRQLRSASSRRQIVDALFHLVAANDMTPGAEAVARRAKVGLRTVYRHFADMESLYREMSEVIDAALRPQYTAPYLSNDWREQLKELARRVASIYEQIMPFRVAADLRRFESAHIAADIRRLVAMHAKSVDKILGRGGVVDTRRSHSIQLVTSFESWRRMRHDQNLSAPAAAETMVFMVNALMGES
jgi:AcrR family transcriptional regulator